jgi:hypothetical protein
MILKLFGRKHREISQKVGAPKSASARSFIFRASKPSTRSCTSGSTICSSKLGPQALQALQGALESEDNDIGLRAAAMFYERLDRLRANAILKASAEDLARQLYTQAAPAAE